MAIPITITNEKSFYYEIIDKTGGLGETCVLIGGLTRDHTIWRKVIPLLSETYRLLLIDNRDSGQSFRPSMEYSIADMAQDIIEIMQNLNIKRAHFVGHSMGGFIVIYLASLQPTLVSSLVLCSTCSKQPIAAKSYLSQRIEFISGLGKSASTSTESDIRNAIPALYSKQFSNNKDKVEELIRFESSNPYPQETNAFKRQATACLNYDAELILPCISAIPACVITGSHDKFYTPDIARHLASYFKTSNVKIIESAAHMIQIERPLAFADAIKKHLT